MAKINFDKKSNITAGWSFPGLALKAYLPLR